MCEELGTEPKPNEIPPAFEDFPYIVQIAINIYSILPDVWEGMSGTYMGKNYSILPYLIDDIYEIEDKPQIMRFILLINSIIMKQRSEEQKRRQNKSKTAKGGIHVKG